MGGRREGKEDLRATRLRHLLDCTACTSVCASVCVCVGDHDAARHDAALASDEEQQHDKQQQALAAGAL